MYFMHTINVGGDTIVAALPVSQEDRVLFTRDGVELGKRTWDAATNTFSGDHVALHSDPAVSEAIYVAAAASFLERKRLCGAVMSASAAEGFRGLTVAMYDLVEFDKRDNGATFGECVDYLLHQMTTAQRAHFLAIVLGTHLGAALGLTFAEMEPLLMPWGAGSREGSLALAL